MGGAVILSPVPQELPPPNLQTIISTFAMQAALGLGMVDNPMTKKREADLPQAKFAIDLLQVLEEKTKGNRSDEEEKFLGDSLYQLRLVYIDKSAKKK